MNARSASHVLMIAPHHYRTNEETAASNVFQHAVDESEATRLADLAIEQHRRFRDALIEEGVRVTVARSLAATPDAPFCNNWFSTHPSGPEGRPTLVLYPMLAPSRRLERRADLVSFLAARYPDRLDFSTREQEGIFLESTGSLVLDDGSRTAYAAISPRTDLRLVEEWAAAMKYRAVPFEATDAAGVPYYHTNVVMFIGHGLAGICLEAIAAESDGALVGREVVRDTLRKDGLEILEITRDQVLGYCGNCLPLTNDDGDALWAMSTTAYRAFTEEQREVLARHGRLVHADLSAFETLGGGSARCLLGEVF